MFMQMKFRGKTVYSGFLDGVLLSTYTIYIKNHCYERMFLYVHITFTCVLQGSLVSRTVSVCC